MDKETKSAYDKLYYLRNKAAKLQRQKDYISSNYEKVQSYQQAYKEANRQEILAKNAEYRKEHRVELNAAVVARAKTDPQFKLKCSLRKRLCKAVTGVSKSASTMDLLGCTILELKAYLEAKFTVGMTWENHSQFGWHIDHILPCASFALTDPEQQKKCFHYTNLQPLWWVDNIKKGDRVSL